MAWSTARKNRARDNAVRLGDLQNFVAGIFNPAMVAGTCIVVASVAVGWVQALQL